MTVINTNTASINAQYNLNKVNQEMEKAMEQLSSGKRINSAGDDAAGIAIAARMESQVRGLNQAMRNAADGQSLVDTAEGALDEIASMLQRMRELALQASNDTNSDSDRESLNLEIDALMDEIDRVVSTTAFNGKNILDGSAELNFQIGSEAGQNMNVAINSMGTNALGSLTGAPAANANLTSTNQGTAAEVTEVKLAFSSDDTYSFDLTIGTADAVSISGDVSNSSASDISGAINTALKNADLDEYASATFSGGVVTLKDTSGAAIEVDTFASTGSGTATYTTINGGSESDEVVNLGGATANVGTTFVTEDANTDYVAAADATSGTAAVYTELMATSGATTFFADVTSWDSTDFDGAGGETASHLEVDFGDFSVTVALADATDVGTFAQAINAEQSAFTFSAVIEDDGDGELDYSLKAVANSVGVVANAPTIKVIADDGTPITDSTAIGTSTALSQTTAGVDAADAVTETGGTKLYLELNGNDDYAFTLAESGLTGDDIDLAFSYTGTSASRDSIATQLQTALNAGGDSTFSVENVNGRIAITNQDNNALSLTAFTSEGTGTILASTDAADASTQGISQLLDDDVNAVSASTTTAGAAVATAVDLTFTADDTYAFKISDGTRTAVIDATAVETDDAADLEAAINYGLQQAGMDASITVAEDAGTITLTQAAGREISVSNFSSDGVGSMLVDAGTGTDGGASYLNDGLGANASTISSIAITTASKASDAIQVIDRALQDIASEQAKLGAVSNRLDHTISNLGSIVINTEASQSRIEDADFAKVTGDLTKAQIMSQAATAMLAQANASKQGVLSLLQG
ncbi:flagellin [bacterium]|nr:flagellin [bacterium]